MQDKVEGSNCMVVAGGNVVGEEDRIGVEDTEAVAYNMDLVVDGIGMGSAVMGVHSGSVKDACSAATGVHSGSAVKDVCFCCGGYMFWFCCKRCMFCSEGYVFWFCCGTFAFGREMFWFWLARVHCC